MTNIIVFTLKIGNICKEEDALKNETKRDRRAQQGSTLHYKVETSRFTTSYRYARFSRFRH